ncbi:MAG: hypothetical protein ACK559_40625, partial [bacterium]
IGVALAGHVPGNHPEAPGEQGRAGGRLPRRAAVCGDQDQRVAAALLPVVHASVACGAHVAVAGGAVGGLAHRGAPRGKG